MLLLLLLLLLFLLLFLLLLLLFKLLTSPLIQSHNGTNVVVFLGGVVLPLYCNVSIVSSTATVHHL